MGISQPPPALSEAREWSHTHTLRWNPPLPLQRCLSTTHATRCTVVYAGWAGEGGVCRAQAEVAAGAAAPEGRGGGATRQGATRVPAWARARWNWQQSLITDCLVWRRYGNSYLRIPAHRVAPLRGTGEGLPQARMEYGMCVMFFFAFVCAQVRSLKKLRIHAPLTAVAGDQQQPASAAVAG